MKYYAVIDTNVIVSSMLKHDSNPGRIIDLLFLSFIIPIINDEIINEYNDVLSRKQFSFNPILRDNLLNEIKRVGIHFSRKKSFEQFTDKDDIIFYEVTINAKSTLNAYLITGNKKHYPFKPFVVSPREMLDIIESNEDYNL